MTNNQTHCLTASLAHRQFFELPDGESIRLSCVESVSDIRDSVGESSFFFIRLAGGRDHRIYWLGLENLGDRKIRLGAFRHQLMSALDASYV